MASKVIYKGVVYGDGVKQVELNTTIKDPLEMDLTPEQIAGEEPLDVRSSYDERNAKLTLNMDIPTAMVIANGVVVTDDQKEKYVYTESEELEGVVTDKGYKLTYGTLGQRFVWQGLRVLFGRTNMNQEIFSLNTLRVDSTATRFFTEQGENINTVQYTTEWNPINAGSLPIVDCYQQPDSAWNSTPYSDEECTQEITFSIGNFYRVLNQNRILAYPSGAVGLRYAASTVNLISPGDNITERTRVTPADRVAIAAGNNAVEKQYIFNFITKDDLYDSVPCYVEGSQGTSSQAPSSPSYNTTVPTNLSIIEKTSDYTFYGIVLAEINMIVRMPSTADTVGFFFFSQYWNNSGAGIGVGIAGFEGEDLVSFIPLPYLRIYNGTFRGWPLYVWANDDPSIIYKGYAPWRTYYQYATTDIIEGTYINADDFEDTNGVHYKTDQPFGTNLFHDITTKKYYIGTSYYNQLQEVEGLVRINEDNSILTTTNVTGGPMPAQTVLSSENSPEYKYAAGVTAKLSYVSKAQWEKASGHNIDDGE